MAEQRKSAQNRQACPRSDEQHTGHGMSIDDAYVVERRLAQGVDGVTELVTIDGAGPFVRKRMPRAAAHRMVWAALAECSCPYLPQVCATYDLPDEFVVVYSCVPGETLDHVVAQRSHMPLAEVATLLAQLCAAVADLHAHGVVHADIAPGNVVLANDGAHLIDFGIARMVYESPARDEKAWGTRGFAAPEQHGFAAIDTRSDVYALGRLAGYALTGTVLSEKAYEAELRCSGQVSEAVCRVLARACAFEPSARYQSAEELAQAFSAAADASRESTPPAPASDAPTPTVVAPAKPVSASDDSFSAEPASDNSAPAESAPAESAPAASASRTPRSSARASSTRPARRRAIAAALVVLVLVVGAVGAALALQNTSAPDSAASSTQLDTGSSPDQANPEDETSSNVLDNADSNAADSSSNAALVDQAAADLVITESSWYVSSSDYVYYVVAIKNTGDRVLALFPTITITGRNAAGNVLFSDEQVLNELYPGETRYWGSLAGGGTEAPATVDIALSRPGDWEVEAAHGKPARLSVSNVSAAPGEFGGVRVTGEVTFDARGDEESQNGILLVAVGRDAQNKPVFGFEGYASLPAEGDTVPFELESIDTDLPAYQNIEVYAYVW